jgi:transcription elongation factor Elf1
MPFYLEFKTGGCPNCGHQAAVQLDSHPADTYFVYACEACDACFAFEHGAPVLMTDNDWAAIRAARQEYDLEMAQYWAEDAAIIAAAREIYEADE